MDKTDKDPPINRQPLPITIILDHLRSAANIGNIFRLADALNIEKIFTIGYTATPPHDKVRKYARGTDQFIPFENRDSICKLIQELKEQQYSIYGIEISPNSIPYNTSSKMDKTAFIIGNEALGVSSDALNLCDKILHLPMLGYKNSINVSNALSAVLFYYIHQIKN